MKMFQSNYVVEWNNILVLRCEFSETSVDFYELWRIKKQSPAFLSYFPIDMPPLHFLTLKYLNSFASFRFLSYRQKAQVTCCHTRCQFHRLDNIDIDNIGFSYWNSHKHRQRVFSIKFSNLPSKLVSWKKWSLLSFFAILKTNLHAAAKWLPVTRI